MTKYTSLTYNKIVRTMDNKQKFCVLEASSNLVVIISLFENVEKALTSNTTISPSILVIRNIKHPNHYRTFINS